MRIAHVFPLKSPGDFRRNLKDFCPSQRGTLPFREPPNDLAGLRQDNDYIDQFEAIQGRSDDRPQPSTLIYAGAPKG
jgi:hypothetical protein